MYAREKKEPLVVIAIGLHVGARETRENDHLSTIFIFQNNNDNN
jgi:hypothetical protein